MSSARDRYLKSVLTLEILIAQVLRKVGGTGCDLTDQQYIAQQVKEWSNSRERLLFATACFTELKETCLPPRKDRYDKMDAQPETKPMAEAKQETPPGTNERPGFIVCGVFTRNEPTPT